MHLTSFVGRERALAAVRRVQAGTRLLTLTGAGGCGKTRLALALAGELLWGYPHGVWFVDLAPLTEPALAPQAVASAGLRQARPLLGDALLRFREAGEQRGIASGLSLAGLLDVQHGAHRRGVRLIAAGTALHRRLGSAAQPEEQVDCDASLAAARAALGERAFAEAWAGGPREATPARVCPTMASAPVRAGASWEGAMSTVERSVTHDIAYLSAEELAAAYRAGTLSPVEATAAVLDRIERLNPRLNAFLYVDREGALAAARAAEAALRDGTARGPLAGVPVTIKDLLDVRGLPTTAGSAVNRGVLAQADSIVTERLRAAGAVILGKTNTPEFGLIPTTENELGDACRNPWDTSRTSGGSSGGAAAAAAAGLGPLHVGTDGGGSIRIPAALCGVFGLKATYGRVARSGMSGMPLFSHTGPITRTVADAALMLDAIAGPDPRDVTAMPERPPAFRATLDAPLGRPRAAFWPAPWGSPCDPEVGGLVAAAARQFAALGCEVEEGGPETEDWQRTFLTIIFADEYSVAGDLPAARKDELAPYTRATLEAGAKVTVPEYSGALRALERFRYAVRTFFDRYDLLLIPVTAVPAFPIGQTPRRIGDHVGEGPLGVAFPFTAPFNLTGQPAASLPCGFTAAGLPVALQVVGRWGEEATVLRACAAYEAAHPWQGRRPALD